MKFFLPLFAFLALSFSVQAQTVAILGDHLTSISSLEEEEDFPKKLEDALHREGIYASVYHTGLQNFSSLMAASKIEDTLYIEPQLVVLALGSQDILYEMPAEDSQESFISLITRFQEENIPIVLVGVELPELRDLRYKNGAKLRHLYYNLAKDYNIDDFHPNLLQDLDNLEEHIHDGNLELTAEHVDTMIQTVFPIIKKALNRQKKKWWWPF